MRNLGVAIIGTGFMGKVHHEALARLGISVRGLLASAPQKSQQFAKEWGIPRGYSSIAELLQDREVQTVHLCLPNRWHFDLARRALESGRHVMCEKPLAMTASESAELVSLAKQHPGLAAAVNYNIRFYPLCLEARERIQADALGDVFHITGSYTKSG